MKSVQLKDLKLKSNKSLMDGARKVRNTILVLAAVICGGTIGFMIIEKMDLLDAFYMTMITISTVGFREVGELSDAGKLFTVALIISGLGVAAYALGSITSFVLEGEFKELLRRRTMENKIDKLKDHYIICGAGQTGRYVINQFRDKTIPFVIIEIDDDKVERLAEQGDLVLHGRCHSRRDIGEERNYPRQRHDLLPFLGRRKCFYCANRPRAKPPIVYCFPGYQ